MARAKGSAKGKRAKQTPEAAETASDKDKPGLKLPSPVASTNIVIADIVLRAAGGILRDRLEKGLIGPHHDDDPKAHRMVEKRGIAKSAVLWGASRLARRSPLGLVMVAGGLAAKVFYDRGKQLESKRKAKTPPEGDS